MYSLLGTCSNQFKGNMHTHTLHSDGRKSSEEAAALYAQAGYDFLAITDHEKHCDCLPVQEGLLMLDGIELAYTDKGETVHIVGVGIETPPEKGACPQDGIDSICEAGGIAILCHPCWSMNSTEYIRSLKGVTAAEIFNSVSDLPFNAARAYSGNILDTVLAKGTRMGLVASDDSHFYAGEHCLSYTMVCADVCEKQALLDALRQGYYYSSQGPVFKTLALEGNHLVIESSPCSSICVYSARPWVANRAVCGKDLTRYEYEISPDDVFFRVELTGMDGKMAYSNAYFWTNYRSI